MNNNLTKKNKYQLRHAAGVYYLLDMQQDGSDYKSPLKMNSMGAEIYTMLEKGFTREQIVHNLSTEYQVDEEMIRQDVATFLGQLEQFGVDIQ